MSRFNERSIMQLVPLLRLAELRDLARRAAEINEQVEAVGFEMCDRLNLQGDEAREFKQALYEWMFFQVTEQAEGIKSRRRRADRVKHSTAAAA
jgi:uncharacterized protein with GYD domain